MSRQIKIRAPAVAGMFYPDDPSRLAREVDDYIGHGLPCTGPARAIIAPHAGYPYSGPVAGTAYRLLRDQAAPFTNVLLLGPSHRVAFEGMAVPTHDAFASPLGDIPIDQSGLSRALRCTGVIQHDRPHTAEHGLEVHLPFLQRILGDITILPVVVGDAAPADVARLIDACWTSDRTLLVISSDLSHYLDYESARRLDAATAHAIATLDDARIGPDQACGRLPILGLLAVARQRELKARQLDLRDSGDTAGGKDEVVGYGSFAFA